MGVEDGAGRTLGQSHSELFNGDREKLTRDMALFSVLGFFFWEERDWQFKRTTFKGKTAITTITVFGSQPSECTMISRDFVIDRLRAAGNVFANAGEHLPPVSLCLPPKSTIKITPDSLVLINPKQTLEGLRTWFEAADQ
jgi:hypothetical protein